MQEDERDLYQKDYSEKEPLRENKNYTPQNGKRSLLITGIVIGLIIGSIIGGIFGNYIVLSNPRYFPWVNRLIGSNLSSNSSSITKVEVVTTEEQAIINVVKRISPAVIKITSTKLVQNFFFQNVEQQSLGSGVIIDKEGYIITNNHVVEGASDILVTLEDGREFKAQILGADSLSDIAILKITGENLPLAPLGDSSKLQVGEKVIAIGNPYGLDHTVTTGVVSALERNIQVDQGKTLVGVIQTDAAINPGNSGGPLVNLSGEVIGINTLIYQNAQGLGFAVSINTAKRVLESVLEQGKMEWPFLGIEGVTLTKEIANKFNLSVSKGVFISGVFPGSGASDAGLQKNDVITSIDSKEIATMDELLSYIRSKNVGDSVNLTVVRGGKTLNIKAQLKAYEG